MHISYLVISGRGWWVLSSTATEGKRLFPSLRYGPEILAAPLRTASRDNDWKNAAALPNPGPNCPDLTTSWFGFFFGGGVVWVFLGFFFLHFNLHGCLYCTGRALGFKK